MNETEPLDEIVEQNEAQQNEAQQIEVEDGVVEGPRIRWAAIIWGLVIATLAGWGLWTSVDAVRFTALNDRVLDAVMAGDPASVVVIGVLVVGAVVLVTGLVGLARRLQVRMTD